jgi:antitoxin component of MazEF toxin-antitoxin module
VAREDSELEIQKLSQELEKAEQGLKSLKTQFRENQILSETKNKETIANLNEQNENLTAENFEYAVENVSNLALSF